MTAVEKVSNLELNRVSLAARDKDAMLDFYASHLGMELISSTDDSHLLGFGDGQPVLEIVHDERAQPRPDRAPGLFHVAYLYPGRDHLAGALRRLARQEWPLQGAADHGVSEAIYLADPEGNGIEIYADRPKDRWPMKDGQLQMVTESLDVRGLLAEPEIDGTKPRARIGHVHLQVSSLNAADEFWCGTIGLDATQRTYPGALFVSAGGYHHHIGLNTWRSEGQTLPSGTWTGLRSMTITVPDEREFSSLRERLGVDAERDPKGLSTTFETTEVRVHSSITTGSFKESQ